MPRKEPPFPATRRCEQCGRLGTSSTCRGCGKHLCTVCLSLNQQSSCASCATLSEAEGMPYKVFCHQLFTAVLSWLSQRQYDVYEVSQEQAIAALAVVLQELSQEPQLPEFLHYYNFYADRLSRTFWSLWSASVWRITHSITFEDLVRNRKLY